MKIKCNFGLLKNRKVGFINSEGNGFCDILSDVKKVKGNYRFVFNDKYIEIPEVTFMKAIIRKENDTILIKPSDKNIISGLHVFTMYDTYGFPMEITKEIMEEKGIEIDEEGFLLMKELQKDNTRNTFKNKDAF